MRGEETYDGAVPPPPWQRAPEPITRRREPITREAIVETALRLLDRDGLDELSMRRIADELDTGPASLYRHVGSKEGLLDLVFDRVIGEQEVPDPEPERWPEQVKEVARTLHATIARHPDVVRISLGRIPTGPNALRYSERLLAILRTGGLSDGLAVAGSQLLMIVVNGFALEENVSLKSPSGADAKPDEVQSMVRDYFGSLPQERFPNLTAVAAELAHVDMDARFELLLDLFVGGLAARTERSRRTPEMLPVVSSTLDLVGYDDATSELHLRYTNGKTYAYAAVPRCKFDELLVAPSKGAYVNEHIKPHHSFHELVGTGERSDVKRRGSVGRGRDSGRLQGSRATGIRASGFPVLRS
jgi:AcrR family transcriptional regulator